jgi:uncharacterized hydrophobic protein (TIGR00271 family)
VKSKGIVVIIDRAEQLPLLNGCYRLATIRREPLFVMVLNETEAEPEWLKMPADCDRDRLTIHIIHNHRAPSRLIDFLRSQPPVLLAVGMMEGGQRLIRDELAPVIQRVKCPVAVAKFVSDTAPRNEQIRRYMVPFWNDERSRFAIRTALDMHPTAIITAVMAVPESVEDTDGVAQERELHAALAEYANEERLRSKLLVGSNPTELLVEEGGQHDTIVMGVSQDLVFLRAMMGDVPSMVLNDVQRNLIQRTEKNIFILREYQGWFGVFLSRLFTQGDRLLPDLTTEERIEVYRQIRRSARPTSDFLIMIASSALIASVGLIMNSPAVIIGAMLIAPLMSAIIGMGLAIVQGDFRFLGSAAQATFRGISVTAIVGFFVGLTHFVADPTTEMLGRSEPNLLDFIVATVSGIAAAYALCRKDVSAALPGVAIAVALVPPLATMGLFAGMGIFYGAYGALLLFLTNLAAITFASGIVFTLLGFQPPISKTGSTRRYRDFQRGFLITGLLLLAVFSNLTVFSLEDIEESIEESNVRELLTRYATDLDKDARFVDWTLIENDMGEAQVTGHISSSREIDGNDLPVFVKEMEETLGKPVEVTLSRIPTTTIRSESWGKRDK